MGQRHVATTKKTLQRRSQLSSNVSRRRLYSCAQSQAFFAFLGASSLPMVVLGLYVCRCGLEKEGPCAGTPQTARQRKAASLTTRRGAHARPRQLGGPRTSAPALRQQGVEARHWQRGSRGTGVVAARGRAAISARTSFGLPWAHGCAPHSTASPPRSMRLNAKKNATRRTTGQRRAPS